MRHIAVTHLLANSGQGDDGQSPTETRAECEDHTRELLEQGFHHIKFGWGSRMTEEEKAYHGRTIITDRASIDNGNLLEPASICRNIVSAFARFREVFGPNPEILFDVKAQMPPIQAMAISRSGAWTKSG